MSFKVAVCYGQPDDTEAFDAYYRDTHMPLARKIPGLSDFTWGKCSALDGGTPPYYAVASLYFPDADTMKSGLQSEEMKQAGKDVHNFATGGVTMYVQEEESVYNQ
ncbi:MULTISPECIES: EthD family reductase [unclassified Rhodococcus (in: high G+C Gram-positive bacteria)]|uniref:EthD family reductase n=1 Tax=unclassified Rhodococcus (in: high G+C Gram-positive bacteria) TaxID=192944 RepID=UPI00163AE16C|nr:MULTISPECIES: EthD family reductase [unclassified Rhodococcus (in: high G+C Gram-positive bacteria)]MBC2640351.1 EthD family reductase [Rhodococcus sp. 3A]MBC2894903.1 EthD family reductase [Rhodococcus sp. 4CII]